MLHSAAPCSQTQNEKIWWVIDGIREFVAICSSARAWGPIPPLLTEEIGPHLATVSGP